MDTDHPNMFHAPNHGRKDISDLLEAAAQASVDREPSEVSGDDMADDADTSTPAGKSKRPRACEKCRSQKVKCKPVAGSDICLACTKMDRPCIMPSGPPRKRQRTVQKVQELEKKIDALTQSLLAKTQSEATPQQPPSVIESSTRSIREPYQDSPGEPQSLTHLANHEHATAIARSIGADSSSDDVIDRGLISLATAQRLHARFMADLNPLCPLINFPVGTSFDMIRRKRPMLSLAILCAGSPTVELQQDLSDEFAKELATRVFFYFERSIDLTQAILIHTVWIGKHRNAKEIGFNQTIHVATTMAHDLGLTKRLKVSLADTAAEDAELKRTYLAVFWTAMCVSIILRHPPMIQQSPYLNECLTFLATSPAAAATDATLCAMVRVLMILEDAAKCFHMDDPASTVRIEDPSVQYSLKTLRQRINDWKTENANAMQPDLLQLTHATSELYINEIALHSNHNVDDYRPTNDRPGGQETSEVIDDFITPSHLDALTACVLAMRRALDAFLSLNMDQLPTLPIVWSTYAMVCMIRLDFTLRASKSRFAAIFLPDLKVQEYLDAVIARFTEPRGPLSRAPASMFLQAFERLRLWHQYRVRPETTETQSNLTSERANAGLETRPGLSSSMGTAPQTTTAGSVAQPTLGPSIGYSYDNAWMSNQHMPIDASMFENLDWGSIGDFEASTASGGNWLGYLL